MKRDEYETELKSLYGKAMKGQDFRLAFDILEAGRAMGLEGMGVSRIETEKNKNEQA